MFSSDQSHFSARLFKRVSSLVKILLGVRAGHYGSDSCSILRDHRVDDREDEDAHLEHAVGKLASLPAFAHHHGGYRSLAVSSIKPEILQSFLEIARIVPELLHKPRTPLHQLDSSNTSTRHRRRLGPRQEIAAHLVLKITAQNLRSDNVTANAAESFRECSHVNIHLPLYVEMIGDSSSVSSQYPVAP